MRKCILILGMHRSGTSALAGVLNKLGITLGSRLMVSAEDNEKGFFENSDIYDVNEGILKSLNSSWDDLFILEKDWWKQPSLGAYRSKIIEILEEEFYDDLIFGIKDPRLSVLFPFWNSVFEELSIEPVSILPLRSPLEVGDSLRKRNGFSIEKGVFLWMKQMLYAEYYSRPFRRVFISFNELLLDTETTVNRISRMCRINYPKTWHEVKKEIEAFLDPRIKHHTRLDEIGGYHIPPLIKHYYEHLLHFSGSDETEDEKIMEIDRIRRDYNEFYRLFYDNNMKNHYEVNNAVPDKDDPLWNREIEGEGKDFKIPGHSKITTALGEKIDRIKRDVKGMVTVIVVNYNGRNYLEPCFNSLLNMERGNLSLEIVMVDNLSDDDSVLLAKSKFPEITVVVNDLNNFARALNLGIRNASGEYIAFLNNDVEVEKNWLKGLMDVMLRDEKIGAVQSKIIFSENGKINSTGVEEVRDFYFQDIGFCEADNGQYDEIKEIDYFSGGSVLLRKSCLDRTGDIDEDFIMFVEDIDFSIRCKKAGWKIFYSPASVVYHRYHGSASSELANFFCSRNRLLCLVKHYPARLPKSIKTSSFYLNHEYDNLYQSLIQSVKKLVDYNDSEVSLNVIRDLKSVIIEVFGNEKAFELFSCIEVIIGLRKIKTGICDHVLDFSNEELPQASSLITNSAFYRDHNASLMFMAATLDKPVIAVFNRIEGVTTLLQECESDRKLRLGQVHELTALLKESEADRSARHEQIRELTALLKESEGDRSARHEQIQELTALLEESEADRSARLEVIHRLEEKITQTQNKADDLKEEWRALEDTFVVRLARRVHLINARKFEKHQS